MKTFKFAALTLAAAIGTVALFPAFAQDAMSPKPAAAMQHKAMHKDAMHKAMHTDCKAMQGDAMQHKGMSKGMHKDCMMMKKTAKPHRAMQHKAMQHEHMMKKDQGMKMSKDAGTMHGHGG